MYHTIIRVNNLYITWNPDYNASVAFVLNMTSSRICYPATRLASDSRSRRLSFLPTSGHYANEDAPDQGNLRISAKSGRTSRAQGGKSRREKKKGDREREARAVRSCEVIYIQTDFQLSGVRTNENSQRHRRKGGTGEDRA